MEIEQILLARQEKELDALSELHYKEEMGADPNYFFKDTAFLRIFLSFLPNETHDVEEDDSLEEL